MFESQSFQTYSADFAHGITSNADREAVKKKLNMEPTRSDETQKTESRPGSISDV